VSVRADLAASAKRVLIGPLHWC